MITLPKFISVSLTFSIFSGGSLLLAEPTLNAREYRPLMAKSVKIEVASKVDASDANKGALLIREAWAFFDSRKWEEAVDRFLSALEVSPRDPSAAEGLTMSLYRSGDYTSAVRLGEELAQTMPGIKAMVVKTALADMRFMVSRAEMDAAREFIAYFPGNDEAYREVHGVLGDASAIESALGPDGNVTSQPEGLAGN